MNTEGIIRIYTTEIRPHANEELNWFKKQPTLSEAINLAALAVNREGKRYSHQRRLRREVLEQARNILLENQEDIKYSPSFDDLHNSFLRLLDPVKGLGELYCYDTALRIGANIGLFPERVYLHAGTRKGVKALGLDSKASALEVSQFPEWLHQLKAYEIEDVLCIFKDRFEIKPKHVVKDLKKRSWCG